MAVDVDVPEVPAELPAPLASRRPSGWRDRVSWGGPLLVTLALGLWEVTQPVLWRDELSGWELSSRGIVQLLKTGWKINGAQLPYYLALHCWMAVFGQSVLSMRLLSVLAMAGAAAFVALAARELAGKRAALAAGLIFAVIPSVSRFAQEVRFYAPTLLFAALATWLLARALERPSRRLWIGYGVSMAAVGCLEIVALALLTGHAAWVALRWWWDRDRRMVTGFCLAAAGSVIACAPVAILGFTQATVQVGWVPKPSFSESVLEAFGSSLFYSAYVAVAVLVLAALLWAVRPRLAQLLTAVTLVPIAAIWAVSYGNVSYLFPRYVLFTLIVMAISAGIAVTALGHRCAVAAVLGLALLGYHDQAMIRQPDAHEWSGYPSSVVWNTVSYQQVARLIGFNARRGDGIVFPENSKNRWVQLNQGVDYYIGQYLPHGVPAPQQKLISETATQAHGLYPVPCAHADQCVGGPPRIWVVGDYAPFPLATLSPAEIKTLRHGYKMSHTWRIGNLGIGLMTRR